MTTVKINDICPLAGASKPSLLRAFGSDNELKRPALTAYQEGSVAPIYDTLTRNMPFRDSANSSLYFFPQTERAWAWHQGACIRKSASVRQMG